ncbi:MAG: hypothetical protein O7G13_02170 [Alphaproteobacteria bacterium]|nr:hypothetical protein [Alphaproteobacteria bacterium]
MATRFCVNRRYRWLRIGEVVFWDIVLLIILLPAWLIWIRAGDSVYRPHRWDEEAVDILPSWVATRLTMRITRAATYIEPCVGPSLPRNSVQSISGLTSQIH